MSENYYDSFDEPWYRCVRCRAIFKLKNLIIRHLISHKVHRFENDSDTKCVEDWERVRVKGRMITKVELPKEDIVVPQIPSSLPMQTNWVVTTIPSDVQSNQTLTVITLNSLNPLQGDESTYIGPFDPVISQTLLKAVGEAVAAEAAGQHQTLEVQIPVAATTGDHGGGHGHGQETEPYRCRYCSAPFAHSRSRAVHESKVHNDLMDGYPCGICQKNFPTIASVQDHYRCTHKVTPPVKKAWKNWKLQGGDINEYVQQLANQHHHHQHQDHEHDLLHDPLDDVEVTTIDATSAAALMDPNSGANLQPRYETYYFHTESGPIAVSPPETLHLTDQSTVVIEEQHPDHHQNSEIIIPDQNPQLETPLKKKRCRKGKSESEDSSNSPKKSKCSTKPKKSSLNGNSPSNKSLVNNSNNGSPSKLSPPGSSPSSKLPKDSPFRYQRLKCSKCETRFRTQWEQVVHLGEVHAEFTCEFCSQIFAEKEDMVRHQYSSHATELGYYQCHFCRKNFGSPRIVQEHVHCEHPGAKVPSTSVALKWRRA